MQERVPILLLGLVAFKKFYNVTGAYTRHQHALLHTRSVTKYIMHMHIVRLHCAHCTLYIALWNMHTVTMCFSA